jgi:membrane fusion protein, multidrug efflux system
MSVSSSSRRNSVLIAAAVAIGFVVWILSGLGRGMPETVESTDSGSEAPMSVSVRRSWARTTQRTIEASARTEPDRIVEIKAETEGRVVAIGAERGARVTEGQTLVELDMRDRQARLAEAAALIRQRELEHEAASRLNAQGFTSGAELAGAEALLVSARRAYESIELDIARTRIVAPFDAVVYDRPVEIGDYVAVGNSIAELVDSDPLIVVGNINERDIGQIEIGSSGSARVLGGREIEGTIRYISPMADESTRTFRVELAIPNPNFDLRVGISAELVLGAEMVTAHLVPPSLLALADDGTIGVKIVDETNHVRFVPVNLPMSTNEGMYVTGLPREARIITVGQGFVSDGESVIPVDEADAAPAQDERTN